MESERDFYDYSTFSGRFSRFRKRIEWKYVVGISGLTLILVVITMTLSAPVDPQPVLLLLPKPFSYGNATIKHNNGVFSFKGNPRKFSKFYQITDTMLNNSDSIPISVIRIENAVIHAPSFSNSLNPFSSTLREIYLNNVSITGKFNRVHIPNIATFVLKLFTLPSGNTNLKAYQEKHNLYTSLFFDQIEGQNWTMNEIGNLGVKIVYEINGFTFIYINRTHEKGEMILDVPYCEEILKNTKGSYEVLSLSDCSISKTTIPKNLEYLNIFDVVVSDGHIKEILAQMNNLEYLLLDMANITLDVSEIPKSVKTLTLSTITLTNRNIGTTVDSELPQLDTLSFAFNQISYKVLQIFGEIFPRLKFVAAFGHDVANYPLLEACLKSSIPWIMMVGFNGNITKPSDMGIQEKLRRNNIEPKDICFILQIQKYGESIVGYPLTELQANANRYNWLGWYKFLSVTAYSLAEKHDIS